MDLIFIIAQTFGILAWLLMVVSYYRENTNKIIMVQLLAIICYCLNYVFLGAFTGMIIIVFEFIRDGAYCKSKKDNLIFLLTIPFYLLLAYFTRNNLIELIPILASLIEGFTLTKKKGFVVTGAVLVYTMWIIYDLQVLSYTGAITDAIIVFSNIFIIINHFRLSKKVDNFRIYNHSMINDKFFEKILKLDKEMYPKDLLWESEYQKLLYEKNKDTFSIIKYKKDIVGYINYLVISDSKYNEILEEERVTINYEDDDILKYKKNQDNYVIIDSIVVDENYDHKKTIKLYNKAIKKYLDRKKKEGYKIRDVIAVGINDFENNVLNNSMLKNKKTLKDKSILYGLNN